MPKTIMKETLPELNLEHIEAIQAHMETIFSAFKRDIKDNERLNAVLESFLQFGSYLHEAFPTVDRSDITKLVSSISTFYERQLPDLYIFCCLTEAKHLVMTQLTEDLDTNKNDASKKKDTREALQIMDNFNKGLLVFSTLLGGKQLGVDDLTQMPINRFTIATSNIAKATTTHAGISNADISDAGVSKPSLAKPGVADADIDEAEDRILTKVKEFIAKKKIAEEKVAQAYDQIDKLFTKSAKHFDVLEKLIAKEAAEIAAEMSKDPHDRLNHYEFFEDKELKRPTEFNRESLVKYINEGGIIHKNGSQMFTLESAARSCAVREEWQKLKDNNNLKPYVKLDKFNDYYTARRSGIYNEKTGSFLKKIGYFLYNVFQVGLKESIKQGFPTTSSKQLGRKLHKKLSAAEKPIKVLRSH